MPASDKLSITLTDGRGRLVRSAGLAAWLRRVAPARAGGAVTIALVTDAHMRRLNRQYRRKDYATDVLTFPSDANVDVVQAFRPAVGRSPNGLHDWCDGDIVIAKGVARRQAREHGHSASVELRVLSLHGLLHLLGYDHERDHGEMRRVEQRLRRKGGLRAGLIERA